MGCSLFLQEGSRRQQPILVEEISAKVSQVRAPGYQLLTWWLLAWSCKGTMPVVKKVTYITSPP
jgi:hypothetical protein